MQWAQQHELPPRQKASHITVHFEHPSEHKDADCDDCHNFIRSGSGNRCRTVVGPIEPEDWCSRFDRKSKEEADDAKE